MILAELARPSAQLNDWFTWAAGQMAHALIGAVLGGALLFMLHPMAAFITAALGYAALKEVPDFMRAPSWATARDCMQDALFVTVGAALAVAIAGGHERLFFVAAITAAMGLAWGVLQRLKGSGDAR
ncbi:MAG: hypothetical protein INF64_09495 [Roseomonas sp.]|nr:hypothetical protein [Roseomonas sp.]